MGPTAPTGLGERFARSVAAGDGAGLKDLLAPRVRFAALTPGRHWEGEDADTVVDQVILGTWFPPEHRVDEIVAVDCATVGSVDRVGYRFRVTLPDGQFVVEQQAYFKVAEGRIWWLRMLCSGFVREVEGGGPGG